MEQLNRLIDAVIAQLKGTEVNGDAGGRSDELMIDNMVMFYDEVRDRLQAAGILTVSQIDEQKRLLTALRSQSLPPVWGIHRVACEV